MKKIILLLVFSASFAQAAPESFDSTLDAPSRTSLAYSVNMDLRIFAGTDSKPFLGPAFGWHMDTANSVGLRTLFSTGTLRPAGDSGPTAFVAEAFLRHLFTLSPTTLFIEPTIGYCKPGDDSALEGGVSLGVQHAILQEFIASLSTGMDLTLGRHGLTDRPGQIVPKLTAGLSYLF